MPSRRRRELRLIFQNPDSKAISASEDDALPLLQTAEIVGGRQIPWSSNLTFAVWLHAGPGRYLQAIYKPGNGERPLHDFPQGSLYKREYATFILSRALGWPNVPLTIIRDGPYGIGSMQLYIDCDPEVTYFDLIGDRADVLQRFAVFDLVANNADRKAGHCLLGKDGRLWSIDHGLTFHTVLKLRTVMLEFWGKPVPRELVDDLAGLQARLESPEALPGGLAEMLDPHEIAAIVTRIDALRQDPFHPLLDPYRNVPWPLV